MKSVSVSHSTKERLKQFDGETYDESINTLIDEVDEFMPLIDYTKSITSLSLNEDTMRRLKEYRLSYGESYDNIIIRLMIAKLLYSM